MFVPSQSYIVPPPSLSPSPLSGFAPVQKTFEKLSMCRSMSSQNYSSARKEMVG